MQAEVMLYQQVGCLQGCRELGKGDEMESLGKTVHNREDGVVALRWGESSDEVDRNVGPGAGRDG